MCHKPNLLLHYSSSNDILWFTIATFRDLIPISTDFVWLFLSHSKSIQSDVDLKPIFAATAAFSV